MPFLVIIQLNVQNMAQGLLLQSKKKGVADRFHFI